MSSFDEAILSLNSFLNQEFSGPSKKNKLQQALELLTNVTVQYDKFVNEVLAENNQKVMNKMENIVNIVNNMEKNLEKNFKNSENTQKSYVDALVSSGPVSPARVPPILTPEYCILINKVDNSGNVIESKKLSDVEFAAVKVKVRTILPKDIPLNGIYKASQSGVRICFPTTAARDRAMTAITAKSDVFAGYVIKSCVKRLPELVAFGLHGLTSIDDIADDIKVKNNIDDPALKILKVTDKMIVFRTSSDTRKKLINDGAKIRIGYCVCKVEDKLSVLVCNKCCGFGHTSNNCKAPKQCCSHGCGGDHHFAQCDSTAVVCLNCSNSSVPSIKNGNKNHASYSKDCPLLKAYRLREIRRTDFGDGPPPPDYADLVLWQRSSRLHSA
jgi:hypothetical protein